MSILFFLLEKLECKCYRGYENLTMAEATTVKSRKAMFNNQKSLSYNKVVKIQAFEQPSRPHLIVGLGESKAVLALQKSRSLAY